MNRTFVTFRPIIMACLLFFTIVAVHASSSSKLNAEDSSLNPATKTETALLFQQVAASSSLTPINSQKGIYRLSLKSPSPYITYFSDEPERYTGIMPVSEFYQHWKKGRIFKTNIQPNAALEAYDKKSKTHISCTVMLSDPTYQAKTNSISYKITLLGDQRLAPTKIDLKYTVLFIDDFHWGGNRFDPPGGN